MIRKTIQVEGMSCGHCVQSITEALKKNAGVEEVVVRLEEKNVTVSFDEARASEDQLSSEIVKAGFEISK